MIRLVHRVVAVAFFAYLLLHHGWRNERGF